MRPDARVALFLGSLSGGGVQRMMVHTAKGLAEAGCRVDLVLAKAEGPFLRDVPQAVRLIELGAARMVWSVRPLAGYLRQERPCAMFSAMTLTNLVALWARRLSGSDTRVVISERNTLSVGIANVLDRRQRLLLPYLARRFYPWADGIVAVSEGVADDLARTARLRRESITVICNPVVTSDLAAKASEPLDHEWFRPGTPPVILAAGRLHQQKDFPTLLRAFALARQKRQARLVILGEGAERERLERLARELGVAADVALPGFDVNPFRYMARAGAFVLSSRFEGLPGVLIQAMACGCPVVSTDCPSGPREILDDGRYGRLVPVGDADALAAAMIETLNDPLPAEILRRRAADFHIDRVLPQYLALLGLDRAVEPQKP